MRDNLNTKKYKTLFVLIEKQIIKTDKDDNENVVSTSYKVKFIDCARFMATSLSNLVDNSQNEM